ncbi:MAG: matrixin family metalloprotease [Bacteroidetes bacterium]|nr:matrixin family metalloprotease [Bacteroidota bacterium]
MFYFVNLSKAISLLLFLALISITNYSQLRAQCGDIEIPFRTKISNTPFIIEGRVIKQKSFWNTGNTLIYTANIIEVYKVFKGKVTAAKIEVVTQGGTVYNEALIVHPSMELMIGQVGLFFLGHSTVVNSKSKIPSSFKFQPYHGAQSFIHFDEVDKSAADPFNRYNSIKANIYGPLTALLTSTVITIGTFDIYKKKGPVKRKYRVAPTITSSSPDSINAGTFDTITILGSNFGTSYTGTADLEFKNANNGGSGYSSVASYHVQTWNDTVIKCLVPSGAGTGTFRVTNTSSETTTSSGSIFVAYNHTNVNSGGTYYKPHLRDDNSSGGYTYEYHNDMNDSTEAIGAFERAMMNWRHCGVQVNFGRTGTNNFKCNASDGSNIIMWDDSCALGGSTLGVSYSYYSGCWDAGAGDWFWTLSENDVKFNDSFTWNFGPDDVVGGESDFESVSLHELGHSIQLGHIINSGRVMHYQITTGTQERVLDQESDITGANSIITRSTSGFPCSTVHVVIDDTAKWTGTTDTTWYKASNWDINMIPDSCNIVYIPGTSSATTQPSITGDTRRVKKIVIQSSDAALLKINSTGSLKNQTD